jgi:transposase
VQRSEDARFVDFLSARASSDLFYLPSSNQPTQRNGLFMKRFKVCRRRRRRLVVRRLSVPIEFPRRFISV